MKKNLKMLILIAIALISNWSLGDVAKTKKLPLEHVINLGDRRVPYKESLVIKLPALPQKIGKFIVLRFDAFVYYKIRGGCSFNLELDLNDTPIKRFTTSDEERMLGRKPIFHIAHDYSTKYKGVDFVLFSGKMIRLMYAPNIELANSLSQEKQGAFFALNISDLARGVDGNTLNFKNIAKGKRDLIIKNIKIGWLDNKYLPKSPNIIPTRSKIKDFVKNSKIQLFQGKAGGFSVKTPQGLELLVESTISMNSKVKSSLIASDEKNDNSPVKVTVKKLNETGYVTEVKWPNFSMKRTLSLTSKGMILWQEKWTNTGKKIRGLPFRHRIFLRDELAKYRITGSSEVASVQVCSNNPTLFAGSRKKPGKGIGITMESDWLRLLSRLQQKGGVSELFTADLALKAGGSIDFDLTITPVAEGGYWTFINSVRERWKVNNGIVERPTFWMVAWEEGKTLEERIKKSLGHLGAVNICLWGRTMGNRLPQWVDLGYDGVTISKNKYPKLPKGAPRTIGKSPDLDIDKYLTFKHREPYWQESEKFVKTLHKTCPKVQVLQGMHPAIVAVYMPLLDRWPFAKDVIITENGKAFEDGYYSQAFLNKAAVKSGWATPYFLPTIGSSYLKGILANIQRGLDKCGDDGFYFDEFSWNGSRRYSRYDYKNWDGYSATLGTKGEILHLKSDNAYTTGDAQVKIVNEVTKRGKFFLGNGNAALRKVNNLNIARFSEGGNGISTWGNAHLSTVPLIYANFGEARRKMTAPNLFKDVKAVVEAGCLYSPTWSNLALDGSDNFVCKLYPISIMSIGAGTIIGKQRLVTTHSGSYKWHNKDIMVKLYCYDKNGTLKNRGKLPVITVKNGDKIKLDVPPKGMIIAEILPEK